MSVERDGKKYFLVNLGNRFDYDCVDAFEIGTNYPYLIFQKLMTRLETEKEKKISFWHNRVHLLGLVSDTTVLVEDNDEKTIVAFHVIKEGGEISFFQVFDEGKGIGRWLIEKCPYEIEDLHVDEALRETAGFWKHLGIKIDTYSH